MSFWNLIFRAGSRIEHVAPRLGVGLMLAAARRDRAGEQVGGAGQLLDDKVDHLAEGGILVLE